MDKRRECFASVASELQQSDIYLTIRARMFETPKPNLNGCRVTEAFLDEIVQNENKYIGLPLYADIRNLSAGNYKRLGHMYDERTGEFHSTQIGSFFKFEKEEFDGGAYLVGYARVAKRNKAVCGALTDLFVRGELKFSFEVSVGKGEKLEDGTFEIDVSDDNFLEGEAVVSFPACEDAVALDLVAECAAMTTDEAHEQGECNMKNKENAVSEVEIEQAENAAIIVVERTEETNTVEAYDTETGNEVRDTIAHTNVTCHTEEGHIAEAESNVAEEGTTASEEVGETDKENDDEEETDETAKCKKKCGDDEENDESEEETECAETQDDTIALMRAEIEDLKTKLAELDELKHQIAEMKEAKHVVAEAAAQAVNPFVSDDMKMKPKYSLLDKADEPERPEKWTLV